MKKISISVLLTALCFTSCMKEVEQAVYEDPQTTLPDKEAAFIPGEFVVEVSLPLAEKFAAEGGAQEFFRRAGAAGAERLYPVDPEWEERHVKEGLHRWYKVNYSKDAVSTKAAVALNELPGVLYVEQQRRIKPTGYFNDPRLDQQWHYYNSGKRDGYRAGADINVVPVWKDFETGKSNVIVSIVDGGIDLSHPDLAAACMEAGPDGSKNFVTGGYVIHPHDHGTHVAGTVGAINNNGVGVAGVAGGSDGNGGVKLMSCQVFDDEVAGGGNFYAAMVWGADHGAVISQNSWGNDYKTLDDARAGSVGAMKGAIDYFIRNAGTDKHGNQLPGSPMKGGVVIFAAGNDNWPIGWPAAYPGDGDTFGKCIAVGSFGAAGKKAYYSNYGDWVDIAAPGGDASDGNEVLSTLPGGGYGSMQGTSMACPHVSGVAALLVSYYGGPGFTNDMLIERLIGGADPDFLPSGLNIGPKIDAYGSFMYGNVNPPARVDSYTASASGNSIDFEWELGASEDGTLAFGYTVFAAENRNLLAGDLKKLDSRVYTASISVDAETQQVGDKLSAFITDLEFSKTYYIAVAGYDYNKNYSPISEIRTIGTTENSKPVVVTDYTGNYEVKTGQTLKIPYRVYDPDHHFINVSLESGSEAARFVQRSTTEYDLVIEGHKAPDGKYLASITATDTYGAKTVKEIPYTLLPNHAPHIKAAIENYLFDALDQTVEINMDNHLIDEDDEPIKYAVTHTNNNVSFINVVGNMLYLTALNWGKDEITITASDAKGASCDLTFIVSARNPKSEPDIYPTQVKDYLYIGAGAPEMAKIRIYNSAGAICLDTELESSAFAPAQIDMKSYAPGMYRIEVDLKSSSAVRTIIKL